LLAGVPAACRSEGVVNDQPVVKPGQLWADNDKRERSRGRVLRIHEVGPTHAIAYAWDNSGREGRSTRVRLDRFKPTSTGYRLVEGVDL
jgi:hypothetical protein